MSEDLPRFYLDEHAPVEIARQLNEIGIDTVTVRDQKTRGKDDPSQLQIATDQGRVLCTLDSDYIGLAQDGAIHAGIVFIPNENTEIGVVVTYLALMAKVFTVDEARNHVEFLTQLE